MSTRCPFVRFARVATKFVAALAPFAIAGLLTFAAVGSAVLAMQAAP